MVSRHAIDQRLEAVGLGPSDNADKATQRHIAMLLDAIEAEHDFMLLLADATPTARPTGAATACHRCPRTC